MGYYFTSPLATKGGKKNSLKLPQVINQSKTKEEQWGLKLQTKKTLLFYIIIIG